MGFSENIWIVGYEQEAPNKDSHFKTQLSLCSEYETQGSLHSDMKHKNNFLTMPQLIILIMSWLF